MAQTLNIDNFSAINTLQQTLLDADILTPSPSVVLTVLTNLEFSIGDVIIVGTPGASNCEITTVTATSGSTSLTAASLVLTHQRTEPITKLFGSQIKVYSASDVTGNPPADTSFSSIGSVVIQPNVLATPYLDNAGGSGFWYKFTYLNTTSNFETSLADSGIIRGGGYGDYATIAEIRSEAGFTNNSNISDSDIAKKRQRAQNIINGYLYEVYTTPFAVPVPPLVNTSCIMLAAGYLLLEEYGTSATGTSKDGHAKISQVIDPDGKKDSGQIGILDLIKLREIILTDDAGNSLLLSDMISSYPNNTADPSTLTADTNTLSTTGGPNGRYFTMADRY